MKYTQNQIERLKEDWTKIAGENVEVEIVVETIYGFCSELASLRLLKYYRLSKNADCGFSENLKKHFFSLSPDF